MAARGVPPPGLRIATSRGLFCESDGSVAILAQAFSQIDVRPLSRCLRGRIWASQRLATWTLGSSRAPLMSFHRVRNDLAARARWWATKTRDWQKFKPVFHGILQLAPNGESSDYLDTMDFEVDARMAAIRTVVASKVYDHKEDLGLAGSWDSSHRRGVCGTVRAARNVAVHRFDERMTVMAEAPQKFQRGRARWVPKRAQDTVGLPPLRDLVTSDRVDEELEYNWTLHFGNDEPVCTPSMNVDAPCFIPGVPYIPRAMRTVTDGCADLPGNSHCGDAFGHNCDDHDSCIVPVRHARPLVPMTQSSLKPESPVVHPQEPLQGSDVQVYLSDLTSHGRNSFDDSGSKESAQVSVHDYSSRGRRSIDVQDSDVDFFSLCHCRGPVARELLQGARRRIPGGRGTR